MKLLFNFALFYCVSISFAQITLEHTDYLQAGDTARLSQATNPSIDFSSTGPNFVWDFASLQAETQTLVDPLLVSNASFLIQFRFGQFAPDRYSSDYYNPYGGIPFDQFGGFLPINIENIFRFTKIDEDSISFTGYAMQVDGNEVPFQSDTIEVAMRYPMNYGDSYNGRAYSKVDLNPVFNGVFIQYRQRETEVDGHGTLFTPYGGFNTIRVKHTIQEQDSLYVDLFGFAGWLPLELPTQRIYEWWAKDQLVPVMKIETQEIGGDEVVTLIEYKDIYLGLTAHLTEEQMAIAVYPNPSSSYLNIEAKSTILSIELYSTEGKLIHEQEGSQSNIEKLDISFFTRGNYLLGVNTKSGRSYQKIIIQ
jgi:hypothetical protein